MIDINKLGDIFDSTVYDTDGDKIGSVSQVYVHPDTDQPTWVSIRTGLFGNSSTFAPLDDANFDGSALTVAYQKEFVKGAPRVDDDGTLSDEEEDTLYAYYGKENTVPATAPAPRTETNEKTVGHDTSGPNTDTAMTRSEERLNVGTQKVETGRARLKKFIVTEKQTVNVNVSHDEVRLVREPITDANIGNAVGGPAFSEEEHEVVLTADRVVVDKDVVPVERIRLDKETVTEQQTVNEEIRKEQIELLDDTTTGKKPRK